MSFKDMKGKALTLIASFGFTLLFVFLTVSAATTISTNIDTGGTLNVTGNATFAGDASINGGDLNLGTCSATTTMSSSAGLSGIASTTPWGQFSVEYSSIVTATAPVFVVADSGTTTPSLIVDGMGRVGISSSTPYVTLGITGTTTSSAGAVIGINGSGISQIRFGTCTYNPGAAITASSTLSTNCTSATGVTTADKVFVTPVNIEDGLVMTSASSTANDVIQVSVLNTGQTSPTNGATITPTSRSWYWL